MDVASTSYTTYISTTPERLWQALTDPAFTRRYWGVAFDTDWRTGSAMTVELDKGGVKIADPAQVAASATRSSAALPVTPLSRVAAG